MKPLLFDTSIWIDYFNGKINSSTDLLAKYLLDGASLVICPVIVMEVIEGIRNDAVYEQTMDAMMALPKLEIDPYDAALGAAELYRNLRKKGVTIRKSNDCIIAYYAIYFNIPILHNDRDFDAIARHTKLKIWKP